MLATHPYMTSHYLFLVGLVILFLYVIWALWKCPKDGEKVVG